MVNNPTAKPEIKSLCLREGRRSELLLEMGWRRHRAKWLMKFERKKKSEERQREEDFNLGKNSGVWKLFVDH